MAGLIAGCKQDKSGVERQFILDCKEDVVKLSLFDRATGELLTAEVPRALVDALVRPAPKNAWSPQQHYGVWTNAQAPEAR